MNQVHLFARYSLIYLISISCINSIICQEFEWTAEDFYGSTFIDIYNINGRYFGAVSTGAMVNFNPNVDYKLAIYELNFENLGEPDFIVNEIITIPYSENMPQFQSTIFRKGTYGLW